MNIQSVSHLTPTYRESLSGRYPPDPFIHRMNIQLVNHLTPTYRESLFDWYPPDPYIRRTNIRLVIHLLIHNWTTYHI
jgi:cyanate lyase